ncbi:MAG: hypothetical protein SFU83_08380 [Meiothermus sp.]|nr:hypothetical protein [Meiothermus sp.]
MNNVVISGPVSVQSLENGSVSGTIGGVPVYLGSSNDKRESLLALNGRTVVAQAIITGKENNGRIYPNLMLDGFGVVEDSFKPGDAVFAGVLDSVRIIKEGLYEGVLNTRKGTRTFPVPFTTTTDLVPFEGKELAVTAKVSGRESNGRVWLNIQATAVTPQEVANDLDI